MPDITICPFILLNNVYAEHPGIEHKNRRSALISLAIRVSKKIKFKYNSDDFKAYLSQLRNETLKMFHYLIDESISREEIQILLAFQN